jgi:hypothetical protein
MNWVHYKPKGLAQHVVANVVGRLASFMSAGTRFNSPWVRHTNLHSPPMGLLEMSSANVGKHHLGFSARFSL